MERGPIRIEGTQSGARLLEGCEDDRESKERDQRAVLETEIRLQSPRPNMRIDYGAFGRRRRPRLVRRQRQQGTLEREKKQGPLCPRGPRPRPRPQPRVGRAGPPGRARAPKPKPQHAGAVDHADGRRLRGAAAAAAGTLLFVRARGIIRLYVVVSLSVEREQRRDCAPGTTRRLRPAFQCSPPTNASE